MASAGDTRASTVGAVSTGVERSPASGHWLLGAAPSVWQACSDWADSGTTFLTPGVLFGAVIIQGSVVHAALLLDDPVKCAAPLETCLGGGPVFFAEQKFGREPGYVALVPACVAEVWGVHGSVAHHPKALLEVPATGNIHPDQGAAWWVVPPGGPEVLCDPQALATLINHGHGVLTGTVRGGGRGA